MNNLAPYVYLKDLCNVNQGLQIPISKRFKEEGTDRYFYITVQFLKDGFKEKYYVEKPPKSTICDVDDIIVVRTGSTGQILTGIVGCFHNNFFKINYIREKIVGKYLYYCLTTKEKQREMKQRAGVTVIPDLNHFMFLDIKIPLIEYNQQKLTVKVLDAINSKIELNNKINRELEAMAKTLYDYWFVQFEFPSVASAKDGFPANLGGGILSVAEGYKSSGGKMVYNEELKHEIPEGWCIEKISDCCGIVDCLHSKKSDYIFEDKKCYLLQLENIRDDGLIDLENKYYVSKEEYKKWTTRIEIKDHDLVITNAGRVASLAQVSKDIIAGIGRNITAIRPVKINPTFLYYSFQGAEMKRQIKLNTDFGIFFNSLNVRGIKELHIVRAQKEIEDKFEQISLSIRRQRELNIKQNQQLTALRDWLLPMLMNGQITVGEAEKKLSMAAEPVVEYKKG